MVFDRPQRPKKPQPPSADRPNSPTQKSGSSKPKKVIPPAVGGGSGSNGGAGGRSGGGNLPNQPPNNQPDKPSPWLKHKNEPQLQPTPDPSASFVEYLRWMRPFDNSSEKDGTKVQLLQIAEQGAGYSERLTQLTNRTKQIAGEGNTFLVKCPWRIRVGGHRGPESILLPAFDALGMPYIPSSTLRGVARTQAIREILSTRKDIDWKVAEKLVEPYFGSLSPDDPSNRIGKVIFLDAYPLPQPSKSGGLAVDMANNIWKWEDNLPEYSPNPNPFFSLKEPIFLIGIRPGSGCNSDVFEEIRKWLITGLQASIGSQVNTGYGCLLENSQLEVSQDFFRINFSLKGQLIHGGQKFSEWKWSDKQQKWEHRGQPDAEVRPVAFKSMLRYWFRTFALGVLTSDHVKEWEATLFGGINPKKLGWLKVQVLEGKLLQKEPESKKDKCGEQEGILTLAYSPEAPTDAQDALTNLFKNLTWLMFHLGGIGQGARRPYYSRQDRPWYRGSSLIPDSEDDFWLLPDTVHSFRELFQQRLREFYGALAQLPNINNINPNSLETVGQVSVHQWVEAADSLCRIVVVSGEEGDKKPYALEVLHKQFHNLEDKKPVYAKSLCGGAKKDKYKVEQQEITRRSIPSPIWVLDLGDYQVVTVFGVNSDSDNPRRKYLRELRENADTFSQIFPL